MNHLNHLKESPLVGMFIFPSGKQVQGIINLAEPESQLKVWWNDEESNLADELSSTTKFIRGFLSENNGLKVSLINCVWGHSFLPFWGEEESSPYEESNFSFDYAVFGREYISYDKDMIDEVTFVMDDAKFFFNDPDMFSTTVPEGPLFTANTVMGKVSAIASRETNGLFVDSEVSIVLRFEEAVAFEDAIFRAFRVLRFFEFLVGHPQNLVKFLVRKSDPKSPSDKWPLQVYGRKFPKHDRSEDNRRIGVLMNAVQNPQKFSELLKSWLDRDEAWREARGRFFSSCLTKQHYDEDRLVAAANVFDLLPNEAFPSGDKVDLPEGCKEAVEECKKTLKKLLQKEYPGRWEHASRTLGRVLKGNPLKRRIRHMAEKVIAEFGEEGISKITDITDKAVDCRNHYVHGSPISFDPRKERKFLTDTLEFIFVASDLIKAGWDIKAWYKTGSQSYTIPEKSDVEAMKTHNAIKQASGHQLFQYLQDFHMWREGYRIGPLEDSEKLCFP